MTTISLPNTTGEKEIRKSFWANAKSVCIKAIALTLTGAGLFIVGCADKQPVQPTAMFAQDPRKLQDPEKVKAGDIYMTMYEKDEVREMKSSHESTRAANLSTNGNEMVKEPVLTIKVTEPAKDGKVVDCGEDCVQKTTKPDIKYSRNTRELVAHNTSGVENSTESTKSTDTKYIPVQQGGGVAVFGLTRDPTFGVPGFTIVSNPVSEYDIERLDLKGGHLITEEAMMGYFSRMFQLKFGLSGSFIKYSGLPDEDHSVSVSNGSASTSQTGNQTTGVENKVDGSTATVEKGAVVNENNLQGGDVKAISTSEGGKSIIGDGAVKNVNVNENYLKGGDQVNVQKTENNPTFVQKASIENDPTFVQKTETEVSPYIKVGASANSDSDSAVILPPRKPSHGGGNNHGSGKGFGLGSSN